MRFLSASGRGLLSLILLSVGCSSSPATTTTNGVNDVLKACQIRATWTSTSSTPCNNCVGISTTPPCACSPEDYAGKCNEQAAAKNKEPTCDGTLACVGKCAGPPNADCACVDACYAGKATCRALASAADGCVAEICAQYCK